MIDTSTTAGKMAVMQAYEDGKEIQCRLAGDDWWCWVDSEHGVPRWGWGQSEYRIKPQTVEEAAKTSNRFYEGQAVGAYDDGFIRGAQWQKDQDS